MDRDPHADDEVLAEPIRARLFAALAALARPAPTNELAHLTGRHPNTTRVQLERLAEAGLIVSRLVSRPRGRPRQEWAVAPETWPARGAPDAYEQLSAWLARAAAEADDHEAVERTGRAIGAELAPDPGGRPLAGTLHDVLAALGFAPRVDERPGGIRFELRSCPYRETVASDGRVVCALHRGITRGLLERLDPSSELVDFVAKDPHEAGCLIDVAVQAV